MIDLILFMIICVGIFLIMLLRRPIPQSHPEPKPQDWCMHEWEKVAEQTLENDFEKKYVCILKCTKCGQLDKTENSIQAPIPQDYKERRHKRK